MSFESKEELARRTALGGIKNEEEIVEKFNNWNSDSHAQEWLKAMMYDLNDILNVKAIKFGSKSYKSDVILTVTVCIIRNRKEEQIVSFENIQVKLVSGKNGSNQIERKHVSSYEDKWYMPKKIKLILQHFCGEIKPYKNNTRDNKRMYMDEISENERIALKNYLELYMVMIVSDIIRGRGRFAVEWILVIHKYNGYKYVLKSINEAINYYVGDHSVEFTKKGGIRLGNITLQRKGGDNGASSANMLQFKADPLRLFDNKIN